MNQLFSIGMICLGITVLTVVGCGDSTPTVPPTPVSYIDVNMRDILHLVESNKVAAENEYKGKYIRLTGVVTNIGENDVELIPVGSDEFQMSGAECKVSEGEKDKILNLRKGQTLTVKGQVSGISTFMIKTIDIKKCVFDGNEAISVPISNDIYTGCAGLKALIPRIKTDAGGVAGLNVVVNLGDEGTCNDTIERFNRPEMLKN